MNYTRDVIFLEDGQIAKLTREGITVTTETRPDRGRAHARRLGCRERERGGYPDFMLKEIFEQPRARDTIAGAVKNGRVLLDELDLDDDDIEAIDSVTSSAAARATMRASSRASSSSAGRASPVSVEVASEFRYRDPIVGSNTLVIAISQSGESGRHAGRRASRARRGAQVFLPSPTAWAAGSRASPTACSTSAPTWRSPSRRRSRFSRRLPASCSSRCSSGRRRAA